MLKSYWGVKCAQRNVECWRLGSTHFNPEALNDLAPGAITFTGDVLHSYITYPHGTNASPKAGGIHQ